MNEENNRLIDGIIKIYENGIIELRNLREQIEQMEIRPVAPRTYLNDLESKSFNNANGKMTLIFNSIAVASQFTDLLRECKVCDLQDLYRDYASNVVTFSRGFCSSIDDFHTMLDLKLGQTISPGEK